MLRSVHLQLQEHKMVSLALIDKVGNNLQNSINKVTGDIGLKIPQLPCDLDGQLQDVISGLASSALSNINGLLPGTSYLAVAAYYADLLQSIRGNLGAFILSALPFKVPRALAGPIGGLINSAISGKEAFGNNLANLKSQFGSLENLDETINLAMELAGEEGFDICSMIPNIQELADGAFKEMGLAGKIDIKEAFKFLPKFPDIPAMLTSKLTDIVDPAMEKLSLALTGKTISEMTTDVLPGDDTRPTLAAYIKSTSV